MNNINFFPLKSDLDSRLGSLTYFCKTQPICITILSGSKLVIAKIDPSAIWVFIYPWKEINNDVPVC